VAGTGVDYSDDRGTDNLVLSPGAAAIYQFDDQIMGKLVYNRACLRPSNFQSNLQSEEMGQIEAILMKNLGRASVTATVYGQQLKDFITFIGFAGGFRNSGDYTSSGIELETTVAVNETTDFWANLSYLWTAEVDNLQRSAFGDAASVNGIRSNASGDLLSVPDLQINCGGTMHFCDRQVFASPALRFVNEVEYRSAPPTTTTLSWATYSAVDPMIYFDIAVGYEPSSTFGVYLTIMNLFDVTKQNHLTIWNDTVGQSGRYAEIKGIFKV
jgi:outer membrane receptor protein involved in Fe transport